YRVRGDRAFLARSEIKRVLTILGRQRGAEACSAVAAAVAAERSRGVDDEAGANLDVIEGLANEHRDSAGEATVAVFLDWLAQTASGDESRSTAAVELVTLHRAKGLEWDVVVIAGCEAGLLPIAMARTPAALAEERRLFYVG